MNIKRFFLTLIFTVCLFLTVGAVSAFACVVPLEMNGTDAMVKVENDISAELCSMEIRPASGYSAFVMEVALKNNGGDTTAFVGLPKYFYTGLSELQSVVVNYKGSNLKLTACDGTNNAALETNPGYTSYYGWNMDIKAGETAYLYITFTATTRAYNNGTQCIDVPLKALNYWAGDVGNVNIVVDSASLGVYSYDSIPTIVPTEVSENGILKWNFTKKTFDTNLTVNYILDMNVLQKFYTNVYTKGNEKTAADLFKQRRFSEAIDLIDNDENLSALNDFKFMKMVCLEKLGRQDEANAILEKIYNLDTCFSTNGQYDISVYTHKRMLYAFYKYQLKKGADANTVATMMSEELKSLPDSKSTLFKMWASKIAVTKDEGEQVKEDDKKEGSSGAFSFKKWLSNMSEPLILTVGIVMIVVVAFCIMGLLSNGKTKKKEKTRSIKR